MFDFLFWCIGALLSFVWWIFTTFWAVILVGTVFGISVYVVASKLRKPPPREYRLTPQSPAVYYNQVGHIISIDPDIEAEDKVREYLREADLTERNFREES